MLLRQTRVAQVESVYRRFFRTYPTVFDLAEASPDRLRLLLRPLGLRRRTTMLIAVAKSIVSEFGGRVPNDRTTLLSLPGVGEYTAACVLLMGYREAASPVDTNLERVLSRLLGIRVQRGRIIHRFVQEAYTHLQDRSNDHRLLHFALIDLAHAVCKPRNPLCPQCPLWAECSFARRREA
jgi:A/G-specific adenine glycosylase